MTSSGLLVGSDDSDVADLDLRPPELRRRRFFNKQDRVGSKCRLNVSSPLFFFLCTLFISFLSLVFTVYNLSSKVHRMTQSVAELGLLPEKLSLLENELHRLRLEFDITRESNYPANETRKTTDYVYDSLQEIKKIAANLKFKVEKTTSGVDNVSHRMTTIENRCLAVCHTLPFRERDKEKQRRRQAEKDDVDEIVFNRT